MKIKRPLLFDVPSYRYGILVAAELASEYDSSSSHPYRLRDCILAKLNLLPKSEIKKNKNARAVEKAVADMERRVSSVEGMMRFIGLVQKNQKKTRRKN